MIVSLETVHFLNFIELFKKTLKILDAKVAILDAKVGGGKSNPPYFWLPVTDYLKFSGAGTNPAID